MNLTPPIQVASYAALALTSLSLGYWARTEFPPRRAPEVEFKLEPNPLDTTPRRKAAQTEDEAEDHRDSDDSDSSSSQDGDLGQVEAKPDDNIQLVLVVRGDLGMSIGKIAAQIAVVILKDASHATLACYKTLSTTNPTLLRHWERTGRISIALRCNDEDELLLLQAQAQSLNLCARSIQDAGRTQVSAGSRTVLGIGPGPASLVKQVTRELSLL